MVGICREPQLIVRQLLRNGIALAEIFEPVQTVAAAEDQIEAAAAGEINREGIEGEASVVVVGNREALPRAGFVVVGVAINRLRIELAGVGAFMRAVAAANDQL